MKLKDYLHFEEKKIKDFAQEINCHPLTITGYLHKRTRLSKKMALIIEKATNGKVTVKEILELNPPKKNTEKSS